MEIPKATKEIGNYNQNLSFFIICCSLLSPLFFLADGFIGAVGLRTLYTEGSKTISMLTLVVLFVLLAAWKITSVRESAAWILILILACTLANIETVIIGWFTSILLLILPPPILVIAFIVASFTWLWAIFKTRLYRPKRMKFLTILSLLLSAAYILGIGALHSSDKLAGILNFLSVTTI